MLMEFKVEISPRAQKYLKSLDKGEARIIKGHINELRKDPYTPRSQCDIIKQTGKRPPLAGLELEDIEWNISLKKMPFLYPEFS
jgi:hypothetical protein